MKKNQKSRMKSYKRLVSQGKRYQKWGFSQNPYLYNPLETQSQFKHLFIGRRMEIGNFFTILQGGGGAFCIEGDYGVGKSTFINMCLWLAKDRNDFLFSDSIEIIPSVSSQDFLTDILRVSVLQLREQQEKLSVKSKEVIEEILFSSTQSEGKSKSGGLSTVLHAEATSSSVKTVTKKEFLTVDFCLNRLKAISRIAKRDLNRKIILSFDNFERAKITNRNFVTDLVGNLRDLIFSDFTLIFIGDSGLQKELSNDGRLRSVFTSSLKLLPLSLNEFQEAVFQRILYGKVNDDFATPLAEDVVQYVYEKCNSSDIRWAFNFLFQIFDIMVRAEYRIKTHDYHDARDIILTLAKESFFSLEESEKRLIEALAKLGPQSPSDNDLQQECGITRSTLQRSFARFREKPSIVQMVPFKGRRKVYDLGYEMKILKEEDFFG